MLLKELRMSVTVVVAGGCEVAVTLFLYIRIYKTHPDIHTTNVNVQLQFRNPDIPLN